MTRIRENEMKGNSPQETQGSAQSFVIEVLPHAGPQFPRYYSFSAGQTISIGRGFSCALVLPDPALDETHLLVTPQGDGFWVREATRTVNGFMMEDRPVSGGSVFCPSGATLRVGRTRLRIYAAGHAVPPAVALPRRHGLSGAIDRPALSWLAYFLGLGVTLLTAWFQIWSDEPRMALFGAGVAYVLFVTLWAAVWALASRLTRHRAHFNAHISIVALASMGAALSGNIAAYAAFLGPGRLWSYIVEFSVLALLLGLWLHASLGYASDMTPARRRFSATLLALGFVGGIAGMDYAMQGIFSPEPAYPYELMPYLSQLAPLEDTADFLKRSAEMHSALANDG